MKTLILDNFDSFTYNLYQYCAELGAQPVVYRNNEITLREIEKGGYTHIIISPGPGSPDNRRDFGICGDVIKKFAGLIPLLGVCLGHQGIIHHLGGRVIRAKSPVHGKRAKIAINTQSTLFRGLPPVIEGMRYHSLIGEKKSLPKELQVTATIEDAKLRLRIIMGIEHKTLPIFGVQFHPESIGTPLGKDILKNFFKTGPAAVHEKKTRKRLSAERGPKPRGDSIAYAEKLLQRMVQGTMSQDMMFDIIKAMAGRGETVEEIIGMARGMRKRAVKLPIKKSLQKELMDTCGTGGSGLPRMNISTTAAFVLAACGVKIAKHGNRAASGRCGSFDLLEKVGVKIELSPKEVARSIEKIGIGFIFAPLFHPAMKIIAPVRKKLGIRTIFNLLGPLTNPARPHYHLLGTTDRKTAKKMIEAMKGLGYTHAMVVVGEEGLDDVTMAGKTTVFELSKGAVRSFTFSPKEIGIKPVKTFRLIAGGSSEGNAKLFFKLLEGKAPAALQNLLLINCAFGLLVRGFVKNVKEGVVRARECIESGAAYQKFLDYKDFSNGIIP